MRQLLSKLILFSLVVGTLVWPSGVFSQETPPSCVTTVIYFGNGILTPEDNRALSKSRLKLFLKARLPEEEFKKISFELAHNETIGLWADVWEATKQNLNTDTSRFYRLMTGLEVMPDWFQNEMLRRAVNADTRALIASQDLQTQVNGYREHLLKGRKVIVVAHSQGNFFANQAWSVLQNTGSTQGFGIVSVANPDSSVGGGGPHTTLFEDMVINGIRLIAPYPPMLPNAVNGIANNGDPRGHSFLQAYMYFSTSDSAGKILNNIVNTINTLVPQGPPASCESIKITRVSCSPSITSNGVPIYLWELQGNASSVQSVVVAGGPTTSIGRSGNETVEVSSCSAWTGTYAHVAFPTITSCKRNLIDPIETNWIVRGRSRVDHPNNEAYAALIDAQSLVNNGPITITRDIKAGLSCPGTHTFEVPPVP